VGRTARGLDLVLARYTPSGVAILEVNLAGKARGTFYHRLTMFGRRGEAYAELPVGTVLHAVGRLEHQTWEKNGQKRSAVKLIADNLAITTGQVGADQRGQPILEDAVNLVILAGNLVRDPETRQAGSGEVTNATVAVNERDSDKAHFIDISLWDADIPGGKGDPVIVEGEFRTRSYENKEGRKVYKQEVNANRVSGLPQTITSGPAAQESSSGTSERGTRPAASTRLDIDDEFPPEEDLPF